ncbi:MAG: hypothetical protein C5B59_08685 [Bacteroidetes bacterium]|nr:MAG: hypothetical protein C5B59_08685 [Bacteroidota bacterium]
MADELIIEALKESNDILVEEVKRLRNSNRILRAVVKALRESVTSLMKQLEAAKENDEIFKAFCAGEFDAQTYHPTEGGLPQADGSGDAGVQP